MVALQSFVGLPSTDPLDIFVNIISAGEALSSSGFPVVVNAMVFIFNNSTSEYGRRIRAGKVKFPPLE